ncbi:helix-turn-helix domain-containing protein [uncultured Novosphingobium sp.]|uniref:helix-turn-helix domain-containing protein n=1 Tax=uncultured Novosphingobium sp. TaxID=292277 RepID=UPI00374851D0
MPARRVNPNRVKLHRSYSVEELARCLGVHKNTVRHWQAKGLEPIDKGRPVLFHGAAVRGFLGNRNASRKQPCPPGTLYCFRSRSPRAPALGMVDFVPMRPGSGNLRALCECCETIMHRRVREAGIVKLMPGCTVQFTQGLPRLSGQTAPSLNCDFKRRG